MNCQSISNNNECCTYVSNMVGLHLYHIRGFYNYKETNMLIRTIEQSDIIHIRELLGSGIPYVLPHHHYIYWMMCRYYSNTNLVVTENDEIIGYLCTLPDEEQKTLFIWQLIVNSKYRNRGIAASLLDHLYLYAKANSFKSIELTIDNNNNASEQTFIRFADRINSELVKTDEYRYENNYDNVFKLIL